MAEVTATLADKATAVTKVAKGRDLKAMPGFKTLAWFCIIALYLPIVVLVAFSFNDNRSVVKWTEFSWRWYAAAMEARSSDSRYDSNASGESHR